MKDLDYQLIQAKYRLQAFPARSHGWFGTNDSYNFIAPGAWQTQLAIKAIHGMTVPWGQAIVFNGPSTKPTKRIYLHDPIALATSRGKWT